jgi:hypothetical protein
MGRPSYVCTICSEHFTRKYSAKRHNITVHHNKAGEIVPLVEYLVGRNSGKYEASHLSWHRRSEKRFHKFGRAMVADSIGSTLRLGGLQRQQQAEYHHQQREQYHRQWQQEQSLSPSIPPLPTAIQDQPPDVMSPTSQSMNTLDNEETTYLSQETRLKIAELKRLVYRYSRYHHNPGAVINCIVYYCNNGDNTLLDEKLEQLRTFDTAM